MIRYCFILIATFCCSTTVCSQDNVLPDSLRQLLQQAKEDSAGVELYLSAGAAVENSDLTTSLNYYSKALQISKRTGSKRIIAKSMIYYSSAMYVSGKNDSGYYYNEQALHMAEQIPDTLYMGICMTNMAAALQQLGNTDEALGYLLRGQKLLERSKNLKLKNYEAQLYSLLQSVYTDRWEYDKSISFGEKVLKLADELDNKSSKVIALLNLGVSYREKGQLSTAKNYIVQAKKLVVELGDTRLLAAALLAEASVLEKQGAYLQILPLAQKSLQLCRESGAADMELVAQRAIATCCLQLKDYTKATQFAKEALELSRKQQVKKEEAITWRLLSRIEYAKGNVTEGAAYERTADELTIRYTNELVSFRSAHLEKKYETEKKNLQIQQLNQDRKLKALWNYVLAGSVITLLLISVLSYRTYRQKQKLQQQQIAELEKEKQLLAAEAVLKGQEEERTRLAKDLHDGLGGMLSGIKHSFNTMKGNLILTPENAQAFERSMNMLDSSIKELRMVAHNLMPESLLKFGLDTALKDFCESITGGGALKIAYHGFGVEGLRLESNTEITLYRVVQELVNNSIKHAQATEAIVQIEKQGSLLTITAEDNGKGFDVSILETAKGMGWANIRNRVEYLKGKLNIHSEPGRGTGVTIELTVT